MKSLPTIATYQVETEVNNSKVAQLLTALFPDLNVSYEHVYRIMSYLSETKVNPDVLPRVIRGIHNISIGTGVGQVIVHVKKDQVMLSVRESDGSINRTLERRPGQLIDRNDLQERANHELLKEKKKEMYKR